eukprot:scaffold3455_cov62-Phaeocystis_antarctica.AAC.6
MLDMSVTLDVSKVSGWLNSDASCRTERLQRKERAGEGSIVDQGQARSGAYPEHVAYICDAGRVEAQRLIERRRALPRVERRAYDAG